MAGAGNRFRNCPPASGDAAAGWRCRSDLGCIAWMAVQVPTPPILRSQRTGNISHPGIADAGTSTRETLLIHHHADTLKIQVELESFPWRSDGSPVQPNRQAPPPGSRAAPVQGSIQA